MARYSKSSKAIVLVICLSVPVVLTAPAHGFKIGLGHPIHQSITQAALQASALSTSTSISAPKWDFHPKVREQIARANSNVDLTTLFGLSPGSDFQGTSHQHFDNNELIAGAAHVKGLRDAILIDIEAADLDYRDGRSSYAKKVEDARKKLGAALHTIQDFYSHSNWVESGRVGVADMIWYAGKNTKPFSGQLGGECSCGSPVPNERNIVTAYFSTNPGAIADVQEGRCIHSAATDDFFLLGVSCDDAYTEGRHLPGMDKDKPGRPLGDSPLREGLTHYELARGTAVQASAAFAQGILLDANALNLHMGLCLFLGYDHDKTGACRSEYGPFVYEQVLPFYAFGSGDYKTDELFTFDVDRFDDSLGSLKAVVSKWAIEVDGTATCPEDPSSVISGANTCLGIRRIADLSISSADLGSNVAIFYCNTEPDLTSKRCGFGSDFLPDNVGFSYIIWPGGEWDSLTGSRPLVFETTKTNRTSTDGLNFTESGSRTVRIDGSFVSRLLFHLGVDRGPGLEPGSFSNSGGFLSFDGTIRIRLELTYQYDDQVPAP